MKKLRSSKEQAKAPHSVDSQINISSERRKVLKTQLWHFFVYMIYCLTTRSLKRNKYLYSELLNINRENHAPSVIDQDSVSVTEEVQDEPEIIIHDISQQEFYPTEILEPCNSYEPEFTEYEEPGDAVPRELAEPYEQEESKGHSPRSQKLKKLRQAAIFKKEKDNTDDIIIKRLNADGYYDEILPSDVDVRFEKPKKKVEIWKYAVVAALFFLSVSIIAINVLKITG